MPDRSEDGRWAFSWAVSPGGYELVRVGGDPARVSIAPIRTPAAEAGADHWPRLTYPLRDAPTLFRQFAVLDTSDPQSLRAFVNAHGLLTVSPYRDANRSIPNDEPFDRYLVHPPGGGRLGEAVDDRPSSGDRVWAESVVSWICEVARMRELVTLWDRVRGRDVDTLQRHMKYTSLHSGILDRMGGRSEGGEVECF
ncbi:MAG: hypothetical protein U0871_29595, partial [Gemmataceae bacterium]